MIILIKLTAYPACAEVLGNFRLFTWQPPNLSAAVGAAHRKRLFSGGFGDTYFVVLQIFALSDDRIVLNEVSRKYLEFLNVNKD